MARAFSEEVEDHAHSRTATDDLADRVAMPE
jgi:hypothetical protein